MSGGAGPSAAGERAASRWTAVRLWLRRVMPRVAAAAAALFVVRLLVRNSELYRDGFLAPLGPLTFLAVAAVLVYYGVKILIRLKRLLLWRVRRRLVITYLFVGLTPIVLLLILGYLAAMLGSGQAMVRLVTVECDVTRRQAAEGARVVAESLLAAPVAEAEAGRLVEEQARVLQSVLPGARLSVWRGTAQAAATLGEGAEPQLTSAPAGETWRGVGQDAGGAREPLPEWLRGRPEWSGLSYLPPPEDSEDAFGTPSLRALSRRANGTRAVAVLVTVPVSRALVQSFRESTGVNVRPFFLGTTAISEGQGGNIQIDDDAEASRRAKAGGGAGATPPRRKVVDFGRDQFGDPLPGSIFRDFWFPVFLTSTDWRDGEEGSNWAFMVDWSWAVVWRLFWGGEELGGVWWLMLMYTAAVFLVLEILALFSAAWMTRAVTGTVHKLYRATEYIKRGDFSHRIRTRSRDQLGELALAFNEMSANIENLLAERVERERLEREVEIAAEVQAQLFPRSVPALGSAAMTGECRAARGVAGDYYDYVEVAPGLVAFALGDVSGKGISASLVMSNLQASLRAQAALITERLRLAGRQAQAATGGGPGHVAVEFQPEANGAPERGQTVSAMLSGVNAQLCRSTDSNRFATIFLALYDDRARTLRYTNAGHNPPALVRADGRVERLCVGGTIVGSFDFVTFEEGHVALEAGDLLVVFSDGLSEAQNELGEEYGEDRLVAFAAARRHDTADNLRQSIFDEVDRWAGPSERNDDQTLVILKAVTGDR